MVISNQVGKAYGTDWAKSKSRDLVRDMAKRTIMTYRKPEDVKVLCFPGYDAAEIFEVYDQLGIPRENIVGVEREEDVADKLEGDDLGIKLYRGELEDWVASQNGLDLDIVSLDYTNPITPEELYSLHDIKRLQGIEGFILHHANSARRDAQCNEIYAEGHLLSSPSKNRNLGKGFFEQEYNNGIEKLSSKKSRKNTKANSYSERVQSIVTGINFAHMEKIFKFYTGGDHEDAINYIQFRGQRMAGEKIDLNWERPLHSMKGQIPALFIEELVAEVLEETLENRLSEMNYTGNSHVMKSVLLSVMAHSDSKKFDHKMITPYSYVSSSGTPMIGDVSFFRKPIGPLNASKKILKTLGYPGNFNSNNLKKFLKSTENYLAKVSKSLKGEVQFRQDKCNRIYLGSSSKPVLSKKRAIQEFRDGLTVEEVKEKYRGWKNKPLSQWKAHVTMGTYDEKSQDTEEVIEFHEEDSDLEKITEEEAKEMITEGIPTKEIYDTYPTSFTRGQLGAFKAWDTMRKKEGKKDNNH